MSPTTVLTFRSRLRQKWVSRSQPFILHILHKVNHLQWSLLSEQQWRRWLRMRVPFANWALLLKISGRTDWIFETLLPLFNFCCYIVLVSPWLVRKNFIVSETTAEVLLAALSFDTSTVALDDPARKELTSLMTSPAMATVKLSEILVSVSTPRILTYYLTSTYKLFYTIESYIC